jgi:hypothetical protein
MKKVLISLAVVLSMAVTSFAQTADSSAFGGFAKQYEQLLKEASDRKDKELCERLLKNFEAQYKTLGADEQKKYAPNLAAAYYTVGYAFLQAGDKTTARVYFDKSTSFSAN